MPTDAPGEGAGEAKRPVGLSAGADAEPEFRRHYEQAARLDQEGRRPEALEAFRAAYAIADAAFGSDDVRTRGIHRALAGRLLTYGHIEEATKTYRDALKVALRLQPGEPGTAVLADGLGRCLDAADRFFESREVHYLAYRIRLASLGPLHKDPNNSRYEVAELSRVLNWWDEAEFFFREALDAETRIGSDPDEFYAKICNNLADMLIRIGRAAETRPLIDKALEIRCRLFGEDSERVSRSQITLCAWM